MVPALHLVRRVAEGVEEVGVGAAHRPVEVELDHRLRPADRGDLARRLGGGEPLGRHVEGEFDDLPNAAGGVEDWIVTRPDPDLASVLGETPIGRRLKRAAAQALPERLVLRALRLLRVHEQAMMTPAHLTEGVAHKCKEIVVGIEHRPIDGEGDDGLGAVERVEDGRGIGATKDGEHR